MIVDLTLPIDERTPTFPGDPKQEIVQVATIEKNGWNEKRLTINSHFSTHIDAPFHMILNGKTLTNFPVDAFIGDAMVIDAQNQNVIESDLKDVKKEDLVFFFTGHIDKAYSPDFFRDNPTIGKETAQKLVEKKVKMVGLDSYTVDNAPFEVHKLLLQNDILIVENLVNLDKLVGKRFKCYVLPLKIQDGDGAPCRVIGIL